MSAVQPTGPTKISASFRLVIQSFLAVPGAARIGSQVISRGVITPSSGGSSVGSFSGVGTVIAVQPKTRPGDRDRDIRNEQVRIALADGELYAETVAVSPRGKRPDVALIMPVVGGTGRYSAVRGIVTAIPAGSAYILAVDLASVSKVADRFDLRIDGLAESRADTAAGVGSRILRTGAVRSGGALRALLSRVDRAGSAARYTFDAGVELAGGALHLRGVVTASGPATVAIIGGSGRFAGMRGSARWTPSDGAGSLRVTLMRVAGGRQEVVRVAQTRGRPVVEPIAGGELAALSAPVAVRTGSGRSSPGALKSLQRTFGAAQPEPSVDPPAPYGVASTIEFTVPGGTLLLAGVTPGTGSATEWPIVGGTGEYAGAVGVGTLAVADGRMSFRASYWR